MWFLVFCITNLVFRVCLRNCSGKIISFPYGLVRILIKHSSDAVNCQTVCCCGCCCCTFYSLFYWNIYFTFVLFPLLLLRFLLLLLLLVTSWPEQQLMSLIFLFLFYLKHKFKRWIYSNVFVYQDLFEHKDDDCLCMCVHVF